MSVRRELPEPERLLLEVLEGLVKSPEVVENERNALSEKVGRLRSVLEHQASFGGEAT